METCSFCGITDTFVTTDGWQETACAPNVGSYSWTDEDQTNYDRCAYREGIQSRHRSADFPWLVAWRSVVR